MEIHYCQQCGARIPAEDVEQGRARKVGEFNYNCPNCQTAAKSARISGGRLTGQAPAPSEGSPIPLPLVGGGVAVVVAFLVVLLYLCFGPAKEAKHAGPSPTPKPASRSAVPQPLPPTREPAQTESRVPPDRGVPLADEKAAEEAFAVLERFEGLGPDDRAGRIARTQGFLLLHGRTRLAERARNLLNDLKKPADSKPPAPKTEDVPVAAALTGNTLEVKVGESVARTWDQLKADRFVYGPRQDVEAATGKTVVYLPYGNAQGAYYELQGSLADAASGHVAEFRSLNGDTNAVLAFRLHFDKDISSFGYHAGWVELNLVDSSVAGVEYSLDGKAWKPIREMNGKESKAAGGIVEPFVNDFKAEGLRTKDLYIRYYTRDPANPSANGPGRWLKMRTSGDPGWGDASRTFFANQPQVWVVAAQGAAVTKAEPDVPPDKSQPATNLPDARTEYAKFLNGLQALITQKGWDLARARVAEAAKDPRLAAFTEEVRRDGECLALAEKASQAVAKGAALLTDGRPFALVQTDGKRLEVGKDFKAIVQKTDNESLRIEQDIGGGRLTMNVPLAKLDAETCLGLSRLALSADPEGKLALALLKLGALREGKASGAAEEMRKLLNQAAKENAPAPKVARLRAWVEFVEHEQAAAQALRELEGTFTGKLGDEAATALAEFTKSHAGTAVLDEAGAKLQEMENALREAKKQAALSSLGEFDTGMDGWNLTLGWEFPGAQGSLQQDKEQKKSGAGSARLKADFSKGGAYVAVERKNLSLDLVRLSFWVRTDDLTGVGLRIGDGGDQCHQMTLPLARTSDWQEVTVDIEHLVSRDHWGGKNDGKWRPPLKYLAVLIGKGSVPTNGLAGTLWLDQVGGVRRAP